MKVLDWKIAKLPEGTWAVSDKTGVFCTIRDSRDAQEYATLIAMAPLMYKTLRLAFKIGFFFDWAGDDSLSNYNWTKRMGIVAGFHAKLLPRLRQWREVQDRMFYGCDSDRATSVTGFISHDPENTTTGFINGNGN